MTLKVAFHKAKTIEASDIFLFPSEWRALETGSAFGATLAVCACAQNKNIENRWSANFNVTVLLRLYEYMDIKILYLHDTLYILCAIIALSSKTRTTVV